MSGCSVGLFLPIEAYTPGSSQGGLTTLPHYSASWSPTNPDIPPMALSVGDSLEVEVRAAQTPGNFYLILRAEYLCKAERVAGDPSTH